MKRRSMAFPLVLTVVWALLRAAVPAEAVTAKTLVVGLVAEPTSMDPGQLSDINSMRVLSSVYDTLVRFKEETFTLEPGLATAWTISADGLTYTFTIKPGIMYAPPLQDVEITAQDFVRALERESDPKASSDRP